MHGQDIVTAESQVGTGWTRRLRIARTARLVALGVFCCALSWAVYLWSEKLFLEQTAEEARATLELYTQSLRGVLRKYEVIPELLASRAEVVELFRTKDLPDSVARANRLTEEVNRTSGAEDTYFMNAEGLTFAASNWAGERPFVGRNFNFRPYFQEAIQGRLGRYFALGTTSHKRGYYFAYPVKSGGETLGVVVVKIDIDRIESSWASGKDEVIVTDANDVIFITSRPDWRFKSLGPLSEAAIAQIAANRQYRLTDLEPLDVERSLTGDPPIELVRVKAASASGSRPRTIEYLVETEDIPEAGWTIHILADTQWAKSQATTALVLAVLLCVLALLLYAVADQRRRRLIERIEIEKAAAERLEQNVRERTVDLSASNVRLEQEIAERKATEKVLRRTQNELVQAGKLAALGQLSAALSHEFNQPLTAIRSYAENAAKLISRNRHEEAQDNCSRISELTGRMADISRHLNAFARKPQSRLVQVAPAAVIDETLQFLKHRLKTAGAIVEVSKPDQTLQVMAGPVRLQQVATNLILNALDAMAGMRSPKIEITLRQSGDRALLAIRDHGPGVAKGDLPHIFDPFFTTKEVGHGLGLGLSISYNIVKDFNGSLRAENHPDGGAVFTVDLPLAESEERVAAK